MQTSPEHECKCSGSKKIDPNAITLEETTVDFLKVERDGFNHYCFEGIGLEKEELLQNARIGQKKLHKDDHLVISSDFPFQELLISKESYIIKECILEDGNYYTVIIRN